MAIGAQAKTQRSFLFFQLIINILYCVHYAFLSATTATVVCIICVIRTLIFYLYRRKDKTVPIWLLIVILAVVIGSGVFTWEGWLSLLPIVATILFTFGQWQSNVKVTRLFVIAGDLTWIVYNIFYLAYADIAGRSVEALSCLIASLRYRDDTKKQPMEVSPNINPIREVKFYNLEEVGEAQIKIAVVAAKYKNKWIFCKQKSGTWELPGGHKEENETILETAKRELFEETGAAKFDITPVCIYYVTRHAMLFYAKITKLGALPPTETEIESIDFFEDLPPNLTLPQIHPKLFEKAKEFLTSTKT
jgi:8-oxo-dGTP diphosphatase